MWLFCIFVLVFNVFCVKEENQDDPDGPHLTQLEEDPTNSMPKPVQQHSNFPLHQQPYAQHTIYNIHLGSQQPLNQSAMSNHLGIQQPPNQPDTAARSRLQSGIPGHMFSA
jgi:hypothetical protein